MFYKVNNKIKTFLNIFRITFDQFKKQTAYEIRAVSTCQETGRHILEIKVTGKSQGISCLAEEIVVDNNFIMGFSPSDIRTITYLATCDRYEEILREEKIKKCYELIHSKSIKGNKSVQLRHKETNEYSVISLVDCMDSVLIDNLTSQDAYTLGYLAGQEQTWKDCIRLKLISNKEKDESE